MVLDPASQTGCLPEPKDSLSSIPVSSDPIQDTSDTLHHEHISAGPAVPGSAGSLRSNANKRASSGNTTVAASDHLTPQTQPPADYPPDDARAMSPRRNEENISKLVGSSRQSLRSLAMERQAGLSALLEKVESVRNDHEKLARNNAALHDYIGGLTKSMSKTDLTVGRKK